MDIQRALKRDELATTEREIAKSRIRVDRKIQDIQVMTYYADSPASLDPDAIEVTGRDLAEDIRIYRTQIEKAARLRREIDA